MYGEPGCPFPAVGRDDEDRIGGDRHDLPVTEIDDADIDPVLWRDEDLW
ncbi:hypothetical protein HRbin27_01300 [bacterium HR27]|nr:hypothetical protein HRbin27_01300 [bacterium HR27]